MRLGGETVVSTSVETFPPGAGPGSMIRFISFPKTCSTSSAVRRFVSLFLLALVAVNGHPTAPIKRRVHSFPGKRTPTLPVPAVRISGNSGTALNIRVKGAGQIVFISRFAS